MKAISLTPSVPPFGLVLLGALMSLTVACDDGGGNETGGGSGGAGGAVTADGGIMPDADLVVTPDMGPDCEFDEACGPDQICNDSACVEAECSESGQQAECDDGFICIEGRCVAINPSVTGAFCTACGVSGSEGYTLLGGLEAGATGSIESESYRLEAGAIRAFAGEDE
ncbi:MAG: hypothetical protein ACE366_26160 [Bradymonadia bacterium]